MFSKDKLIQLFGIEWTEALSEYISGKDFYQLACRITELRKTKEIYPSSENIFRAFRETPYDKIKCVLYAQDVYPTATYGDGLAFSNSLSKDISPTLKIILKEVDNCYPQNVDRIDYGRLDLQDLSRWSKQGILLLNAALTVEKGKAGSHLELWKPFTVKILQTLNTKNEVIWLLLGKEAQGYKKYITNQTHSIIEAAHPAVSCYGGSGFFDSNIFRECNNQLLARNKKELVW